MARLPSSYQIGLEQSEDTIFEKNVPKNTETAKKDVKREGEGDGKRFSYKVVTEQSGNKLLEFLRMLDYPATKEDVYSPAKLSNFHKKDDGLKASLRIITQGGQGVQGYSEIGKTHRFVLSSGKESQAGKNQIAGMIDTNKLLTYGEAPKLWAYSGAVMQFDAQNADWLGELERFYDQFKAPEIIKMDAKGYLIYGKRVIEGYILNLTTQSNSKRANMRNFSFSMFVTRFVNLPKRLNEAERGELSKAQQEAFMQSNIRVGRQVKERTQEEILNEAIETAKKSAVAKDVKTLWNWATGGGTADNEGVGIDVITGENMSVHPNAPVISKKRSEGDTSQTGVPGVDEDTSQSGVSGAEGDIPSSPSDRGMAN